jgi:predicted dienelactone hydrolase
LRLVLLGTFVFLIAGCAAAERSIGVTDFMVPAKDGEPEFSARIWYSGIGGTEQRFGSSRIRPGYVAVPNAVIASQKQAPLIVLAHGSGGSAESMAWLATDLARMGALVVAADHPDSSDGDPNRASILKVWTQPQDIRRLLDQLLATEWRARIDQERISAIGFSLGGTTAMLLAGTRLQFERVPVFCANHDDGSCRAFRHRYAELDSNFFARANANLIDGRVRAAVAIAPGFTESITAESQQSLGTPILMIVGEKDQQLPPQTHVQPIRHLLSPHIRYKEIADAQHFSFLPICGDDAIDVLAETDEEFVCQEVGSKSRAEIHAETLEAIENFLLTTDILIGQSKW